MQKQKTFKFGWWRDDEIEKIKDFCKGVDYFVCGNFEPYNRHNGYDTDIEKFLDVIPCTKVKLVKKVIRIRDWNSCFTEVTATTFFNEV